ncbi:hypothetical protein HZY97_05615 [Sphingomonas sp. R-74633]|uniref:hypothetical protein n=1 Tax=Sphingomonas sp. R-74633 TaxID=2751188 RepID=UPI0015D2AC43|nr:hypothetical protein [Sphingomonas sp. R-74633]NYT40224.1 hypothetical protein [Sphingomonas sp. R-74633]
MHTPSDCPKCGSQFTEGYIADHAFLGTTVSTFVGGQPAGLLADIARGGAERYRIQTWRCDGCGYLESYARAPLHPHG